MEDLFLLYPTALQLKELGFNEPCLMYWNDYGKISTNRFQLHNKIDEWCQDYIEAPTYDQAFEWLLKIINKDVLFDSNKYSIRFDDVYYSLLLGGVVMFVFVTKEKVVIELIKVLKEKYE